MTDGVIAGGNGRRLVVGGFEPAEIAGVGPTCALCFDDTGATADSTLRFDLPRAAEVSIELFDLSGRRVTAILQGHQPAGRHALRWSPAAGGGPLEGGSTSCVSARTASARRGVSAGAVTAVQPPGRTRRKNGRTAGKQRRNDGETAAESC